MHPTPQAAAAAAGSYSTGAPDSYTTDAAPGRPMSEPARAALQAATSAMKRYGWLAFWTQLTLSIISGVILLFSVAFTSQVRRGLSKTQHSTA
jgi:hypothetical protein